MILSNAQDRAVEELPSFPGYDDNGNVIGYWDMVGEKRDLAVFCCYAGYVPKEVDAFRLFTRIPDRLKGTTVLPGDYQLEFQKLVQDICCCKQNKEPSK